MLCSFQQCFEVANPIPKTGRGQNGSPKQAVPKTGKGLAQEENLRQDREQSPLQHRDLLGWAWYENL